MKRTKLCLKLMLVFALAFSLQACSMQLKKGQTDLGDTTISTQSIRITNTQSNIAVGQFAITAQCYPEGSESKFSATLQNKVQGVKLNQTAEGYVLDVGSNAINGSSVSVVVTSGANFNITDVKSFTLSVPEVDFTPIRTQQQLVEIGANAKSMRGNYKLFNDIVLESEWTPLGYGDTVLPFKGILDGNGFAIKNISMVYGADFGANNGFISQIDELGAVKNIEFAGRTMKMGLNGAVVAGINRGLIQNIVSNVKLTTTGGFAAAIVGTNSGTIKNSYAIGATVAASGDSGVVGSNLEGTVIGTFADKNTTMLNNFYAVSNQQESVSNGFVKPTALMQTADTFTQAAWDSDVWYLQNGYYPLLKNWNFSPPVDTRAIEIINAGTEIDVGTFENNNVLIQTKRTNASSYEIAYSITEIQGVTLEPLTGVIHFDGLVADGMQLTITATLVGTDISSTKTYTICNDGYNTTTGMVISTEAQLYDNLIVNESGENAVKVARNMSRKIKLGADIKLVNNKAWPGVAAAFSGNFDGQGYTISGIDVDKTVATSGYGFFNEIKGAAPSTVVVERLILKGKVSGSGNHVAGLTKLLSQGTIKNCIIDMSVTSDSIFSGKVAGFMSPGTDVSNTIALGYIGTTLPFGEPGTSTANGRTGWAPFASGAFMGRDGDDASNPHTITNSFAMHDKENNLKDVGFSVRKVGTAANTGATGEGGNYSTSSIITLGQYLTATTYASKGYDSTVWFIKDGFEPTLKTPNFVEPTDKTVYIKITTSKEIYNMSELTGGVISLAYESYNTTTAPSFALKTAVTGVSIDLATGTVTINGATAAKKFDVAVLVSVIGTTATDYYNFSVVNDGYDPSVGMRITNEDELYETLIVDPVLNNADKVAINLTRNIYLANNIVLDKYKNWKGVEGNFTGKFDGKGYTISGFDVNISNSDSGYGFFRKIDTKDIKKVVVERLIMEGNINYQANTIGVAASPYVGGLVKEFAGGLIKNVLVNMNITTNTWVAGKVIGYMLSKNAKIECSVAMGTITSTMPVLNNGVNLPANGWADRPCGAFIAKTEAKDGIATEKPVLYSCWAQGAKTTTAGFTIRQTLGENTNLPDPGAVGFKSDAQLKSGSAFADFDTRVWSFVSGQFPTMTPQS